MVCFWTFPHTDSPFVRMYEDVDYEWHLFVMANRYFHLLNTEVLTNYEIEVDIDLFYIGFPFEKAQFIQCAQYWLADLVFEVLARQTHSTSCY